MFNKFFSRKQQVRSITTEKRVLVVGFFSTIGDIECLNVISGWLQSRNLPFDVAPYGKKTITAIEGALDLATLNPDWYTHLVVVCGPCKDYHLQKHNITRKRFGHCRWIGMNLSMIDELEKWNPFDNLYERDSNRQIRPDLALLAEHPFRPAVVSRCLVRKQREYGDRQQHDQAVAVINGLIERKRFSVLDVDTLWPAWRNSYGMKSSEEAIALMGRTDLVLTNRLHGMIFGLKAGVPVIAVDSIKGGAKVMKQAEIIGWPMAISAEKADEKWMEDAVKWCMSEEARPKVKQCVQGARQMLQHLESDFVSALD